MKEFDHTGLLLAEYQGKLFEKSTDLNCSSAVFLRRFLHSDYVKKMDLNDTASLPLDINEGIDSIQKQFGDSNYGKTKYSKNAMFWIGYMYRYVSYTRGVSTRFVMKLFSYKQLNDVYYSFHTQNPEWCVQSLLEMNNLSEEIFDNNLRKQVYLYDKTTDDQDGPGAGPRFFAFRMRFCPGVIRSADRPRRSDGGNGRRNKRCRDDQPGGGNHIGTKTR